MAAVTGGLYALLGIYVLGWLFGMWVGNFSLLLLILTLVTMAYWLAERLRFQPQREAAAAALGAHEAQRRAELARKGIDKVDGDVDAARRRLSKPQAHAVGPPPPPLALVAQLCRYGLL